MISRGCFSLVKENLKWEARDHPISTNSAHYAETLQFSIDLVTQLLFPHAVEGGTDRKTSPASIKEALASSVESHKTLRILETQLLSLLLYAQDKTPGLFGKKNISLAVGFQTRA
jgi:hypothetical protein